MRIWMRPCRIALVMTGTLFSTLIWDARAILADQIPEGDSSNSANQQDVDFLRDIAPIFTSHCLGCHNPNIRKGELSLSTIIDLRENEYVIEGDPGSSYLVDLITSHDGQPAEMPLDGPPLNEQQVHLISKWIDQGAEWPDEVSLREASKADSSWWSLQPISRDGAPDCLPDGSGWHRHPIDRFLITRLQDKGLQPNEPAERDQLIRRLYYDLIGLPPTPAEVQEFQNDSHPLAYQRLVDRLLASPQYGQRWGRHWLDVIRFGESSGFEQNFILDELWPFRDYVLDSLNQDRPFDQLIREHIAGDVVNGGRPESVIGSAFLVAGPYDAVKNQDADQAAQIRANTIDEMIRATSESFLGLTVGCARCHDHKFDPILQQDYYSLYAVLSGTRHDRATWVTPQQKHAHEERLRPLQAKRDVWSRELSQHRQKIQKRADSLADQIAKAWPRPPVNRRLTEERFAPVEAKFIRLISEGADTNPSDLKSFNVDEFEVFSAADVDLNVASQANGSIATGTSRNIDDFAGAYGPHLAIDGKFGERFLATGGSLTIEFSEVHRIDRAVFSSGRIERVVDHGKFKFPGEYRLEISLNGNDWKTIADSHDRQPVNDAWRAKRLLEAVQTPDEKAEQSRLQKEIRSAEREIRSIPPLRTAWIGKHDAAGVEGPFHVFVGGSPTRPGEKVLPQSMQSIETPRMTFDVPDESDRRIRLAEWITHADHPLTSRVLVNRLWQHHFGSGLVRTPNDFGYMGVRPSHPKLLDWLATALQQNQWRLKPMHRLIVTSMAYQQSSQYRGEAAAVDADAVFLWRFPPRRLSAEEIRDGVLQTAGVMNRSFGGPGFRLYRYMRDNVSTYSPLDQHGPDTYRRAVYHQNARASVVDLMTDFDQPDCAFSTPRRVQTTTPLQALTMLNHSFTLDMAKQLIQRVEHEVGDDPHRQVQRLFDLCYQRSPIKEEQAECLEFIRLHGPVAFARVLLNTSEMIHVR